MFAASPTISSKTVGKKKTVLGDYRLYGYEYIVKKYAGNNFKSKAKAAKTILSKVGVLILSGSYFALPDVGNINLLCCITTS